MQRARRRPARARASCACGPVSTTRCCSLGTRCSTRTLVEAAAALDRDDWMRAAVRNMHFLLSELRRDDGRLLRSWQGGRADPALLAYAEDYAALLEALLTLAELDDVAWLDEARTRRRGSHRPVRGRRERRLLHDRDRRRGVDRPARRTRRTTRRRRRTRSPRTGCSAWPRSRVTRRLPNPRPAGCAGSPRCWLSTRPRSRTCSARSNGWSRRRSRSPSSAILRTRRHARCGRGRDPPDPGERRRSRPARPPPRGQRCSRTGPRSTASRPRTCASTTRAARR